MKKKSAPKQKSAAKKRDEEILAALAAAYSAMRLGLVKPHDLICQMTIDSVIGTLKQYTNIFEKKPAIKIAMRPGDSPKRLQEHPKP